MVVIVYSTVAVKITPFDCRDRRPRRSAPLNAPNRQHPNIVGADSISARLFRLNRSPRRTTDGRPYGMVVTVYSTEAVRLPRSSVGEGIAPPVLFRLNRSPRRTTDGRPYGVWWQLFVPPQPCCKSLPLGEGGRQVVKSSATLFRNKI